jgi:tetratricopeptide (TPR) repeat protein
MPFAGRHAFLRIFLMNSSIFIILLASAAPALAQSNSEIGYDRGSLGYEALVSNQNDLALAQLTKSRAVPNTDPAKLINLGRAYQRLGNAELAEQSFTAALNCKDEMDLVLADGREMNSRKAAKLALKELKTNKAQ